MKSRIWIPLMLAGCLIFSQAQAQEATEIKDPIAASEWLSRPGCFCVKPDRLAEAIFRIKNGKLQLELERDRATRREDAILGNHTLQIKETRKWCDEQVNMVRTAYGQQIQFVVEQTSELVSDVSESYGRRLKAVAGLIEPPERSWYEHPVVVGTAALIVGGALGVGIGAIAWK